MVFQSLAQLPSSVKFKSQLNNSLIVSFCAFKAVLFFFFDQTESLVLLLSQHFIQNLQLRNVAVVQLVWKKYWRTFFLTQPSLRYSDSDFFCFSLSITISLSASFHLVGNGLQNKHQMCSLKALLFAACDFDTVPLMLNHIMSATFTFAALTTSQPIDIYWLRWTWANFIRAICKTLEHNHAETHTVAVRK